VAIYRIMVWACLMGALPGLVEAHGSGNAQGTAEHEGTTDLERSPAVLAGKGETTISVVEENLFLLGTFDDHTANRVIALLEDHSKIKRIVLTANGGSINDRETLRLGRHIRKLGLDTHLVAGGVATSGGVSLLLAGANRSVGDNTFLGVHSWAQCSRNEKDERTCKSATDFEQHSEEHDLHRDYTIEMLGSDAFYWFSIKSAPHDSIYWLSSHDLEEFGVTNTNFDGRINIPFEEAFHHEYELTCHNCPQG
jgi:hypothetical protein